MELDDLKNSWDAASKPTNQKEILNAKMIEQMTQIKYKSRLRKIINHETLGTLFAFGGVAYIIVNFNKLTTPFFQGIGIVTALILIVLPIISLVLLNQLNSVGDLSRTYAETLRTFALQKLRFIRFQQLSVVIASMLMVFVILLMPKFTGGPSLNEKKYFWAITISIGYIFLSFFSRWVIKYYSRTLTQAEELLKELEG
jgi:hypothetical protein